MFTVLITLKTGEKDSRWFHSRQELVNYLEETEHESFKAWDNGKSIAPESLMIHIILGQTRSEHRHTKIVS